jgi:hypothetical protein
MKRLAAQLRFLLEQRGTGALASSIMAADQQAMDPWGSHMTAALGHCRCSCGGGSSCI